MQRKVPAEKARAAEVSAAADADRPDRAGSHEEQECSDRDHHRETEIHEVSEQSRSTRAKHQADHRECIGRLVKECRDEHPPGDRPNAMSFLGVGGHGTCEGDTSSERVDRESKRGRTPMKRRSLRRRDASSRCVGVNQSRRMALSSFGRVFMRMGRTGLGRVGGSFVMVECEEAFEEEERKEAKRRPTQALRSAEPDRFGHHVEKHRPKHCACRGAQINLEPGVTQDDRERQEPADQAHADDSEAEHGEGRRHRVRHPGLTDASARSAPSRGSTLARPTSDAHNNRICSEMLSARLRPVNGPVFSSPASTPLFHAQGECFSCPSSANPKSSAR